MCGRHRTNWLFGEGGGSVNGWRCIELTCCCEKGVRRRATQQWRRLPPFKSPSQCFPALTCGRLSAAVLLAGRATRAASPRPLTARCAIPARGMLAVWLVERVMCSFTLLQVAVLVDWSSSPPMALCLSSLPTPLLAIIRWTTPRTSSPSPPTSPCPASSTVGWAACTTRLCCRAAHASCLYKSCLHSAGGVAARGAYRSAACQPF